MTSRATFGAAILSLALATSCQKQTDVPPAPSLAQIPKGTALTLELTDKLTVSGTLVEVQPEFVILADTSGKPMSVPHARIARIQLPDPPVITATAKDNLGGAAPAASAYRGGAPPAPSAGATPAPAGPAATPTPPPAPIHPVEPVPEYREVTLPTGTALPLVLQTTVASDRNAVEDPVNARVSRAVRIEGMEVIPAGSIVSGNVVEAVRAAKVKGLARIAVRFSSLRVRGADETHAIATDTIRRQAAPTKKKDAAKIGGGAAGGAIVGAIIGGKKGAAIGTAVGGGAGTAAVLTTRGNEIALTAGQLVTVRLQRPLTIHVRIPPAATAPAR